MFLAQEVNNEQVKSDFYVDVFEKIVNSEDIQNKMFIDSAILEAVGVANGRIDVFSISNSYYFLVTTLLQKFKKELVELNSIDSVPHYVYKEILSILR